MPENQGLALTAFRTNFYQKVYAFDVQKPSSVEVLCIRRKERSEDCNRKPRIVDNLLSRFGNAAGKSH